MFFSFGSPKRPQKKAWDNGDVRERDHSVYLNMWKLCLRTRCVRAPSLDVRKSIVAFESRSIQVHKKNFTLGRALSLSQQLPLAQLCFWAMFPLHQSTRWCCKLKKEWCRQWWRWDAVRPTNTSIVYIGEAGLWTRKRTRKLAHPERGSLSLTNWMSQVSGLLFASYFIFHNAQLFFLLYSRTQSTLD